MRTRRTARSPLRWLAAACLAAGCGDARTAPAELAAPGLDASKAALVASLDAWKADRRSTGVVIGTNPPVGVVDSARVGRPLLGYDVVGAFTVVEKARPFAVRLLLDRPRETVTARYLVMGRDPLWVFRHEDFERMLHWEHTMSDGEGGDGPTVTSPADASGSETR